MTTKSKTYGVDMTRRIEAYYSALRSAREVRNSAERSARTAMFAAERSARETCEPAGDVRAAYDSAVHSAWEVFTAAAYSAWGALACGDPLIDWIIANSACEIDALTILRALPADLDTLDAIALAVGHGVWENLRDEAIRAGVISR